MATQINTLTWLRQAPSLRFGQAEPGLAGAGRTPSVGEDIPLLLDTPVGAPLPGQVVYAGYHGWGGQVDIQTMLNGMPVIEELIHLDTINVHPGQLVDTGSLLGLSGGQLSGGAHPNSPRFSTGPHVKFTLFSGTTWGNPQTAINPAPVIAAVAGGSGAGRVLGATGAGSPVGSLSRFLGSGQFTAGPGSIKSFQDTLGNITNALPDIELGLLGGALILLGLIVFFFAGRNGSGSTHAQTVTQTVTRSAASAAILAD